MMPELRKQSTHEVFLAVALSLMVFAHARVGMRLLSPLRIARVCALLLLYAFVIVPAFGGSPLDTTVMSTFAVAFAGVALCHYALDWRDMNAGRLRHSYSTGISRIETRGRFPKWFRHHRRVYRFLEPFVWLMIAGYGFILSPALGVWLLASTLCLRFFEEQIYRLTLTRRLDVSDSLVESEVYKQIVAHYAHREGHSFASTTDSVLPTGLGPDIAPLIAKCRVSKP